MRRADAGSRLRERPPTPSIINPAGFSFTSAAITDRSSIRMTGADRQQLLEITDAITRPQKILELLKADQQAA